MKKSFEKKRLFALLAVSIVSLSLASVITSLAWFVSGSTIKPNVTSGIISSYFDSLDNPAPGADPGTQGNPYVITRPIHYYNLVYLLESDYEGFDGNNTYFQFGKDLDDSGTPKFYSYNDSGVIVEGEYTTSLNMQYYNNVGMAGRELSPIGSASHPFNCNIVGNNLTVENLHITGKGKTDIGVFGYVGSGANISNLYFDNVTVDLNVTNVSEINASDHAGTHGANINFGYIAGHVKQSNSFSDVYINNVSMTNSATPLNAALRSDFGFFGKCDDATIPQTGEPEFKHSWDSGDVYNYFENNYGSISGQSFRARDTEYASSASGVFSQAVTKSNNSYTFNSGNGKKYSLATAGYQYDNQTYNVQYFDSSNSTYNYMTGSSVSNVAPNDQTNEGSYVYYDESVPANKKWIHYNIVKTGGQVIEKHYNAFTLSYKGVVNTGSYNDTNTTYYLIYDASSSQLRSTTTAPTSYESTPQYYFAFLPSKDSPGLSNIEDGFDTTSYYLICCPYFDKYLYMRTNQGMTSGDREYLSFGDYEASTQSGYTNRFTISGANKGTISYSGDNGEFYLTGYNVGAGSGDSNPKGCIPSGNAVKLSFTLNGSSHSSRQESSGYILSKVTNLSSLVNGDVVSFVIYDKHSQHNGYRAMSSQNPNNRASYTPTCIASDYSTIEDNNEIFKFQVSITGSLYSFYDIENEGYLYNASSSSNYLRSNSDAINDYSKWSISVKSSTDGTYTISNSGYSTDKYIYCNYNGGTPIFSAYKTQSGSDSSTSLYMSSMIYKRIPQTVTIKGENAYDVVATTQSGEVIIRTIHDVYYYDPTDISPNRQLLTFAPNTIFEWDLASLVTTITVPPHTVTGWVLVTSASDLTIGDQYIMGCYSQNKVAKGYDSAGGRMNSSGASFSGDHSLITNLSDGAYQFILGGNSSSGYTFSCDDGMLYGGSDGEKGFVNFTGLAGSNLWNISFDESNNAIISNTVDYSLKFNTSYFGNYKAGSTPIQLYKLVTTAPEYIGDKIGGGYSPHYIDTVGTVTYGSSYMSLNDSFTNVLTDTYIDSKFYNTAYTSNSIIVRIPNRGSLDFGTLEITTTGSGAPVFLNNGMDGPVVTMSDVSCTGQTISSNTKYTLYLNKYNIYKLSYCTLDSSGNINGSFDQYGEEIFMKENSSIDEFVLVIGLKGTSTTLNVSHIDITFPEIKGNIGDFGKVGFRNAPNTVPGEIFSFTYEFNSGVGNVNNAVTYDATNNAYYLTFTSSVATTLYVYNYDANAAKVYVNNMQYFGSYNKISITAS